MTSCCIHLCTCMIVAWWNGALTCKNTLNETIFLSRTPLCNPSWPTYIMMLNSLLPIPWLLSLSHTTVLYRFDICISKVLRFHSWEQCTCVGRSSVFHVYACRYFLCIVQNKYQIEPKQRSFRWRERRGHEGMHGDNSSHINETMESLWHPAGLCDQGMRGLFNSLLFRLFVIGMSTLVVNIYFIFLTVRESLNICFTCSFHTLQNWYFTAFVCVLCHGRL